MNEITAKYEKPVKYLPILVKVTVRQLVYNLHAKTVKGCNVKKGKCFKIKFMIDYNSSLSKKN